MSEETKSAEQLEEEKSRLLDLLITGTDLKGLNEKSRILYYKEVCASVGLNPLTKPLDFLALDGKIVLYAKKDCTDQLRAKHRISVKITDKQMMEGIYVVTAQATMPNGRVDESTGAVALLFPKKYYDKKSGSWKDHPQAGKPLDGLDRANGIMKAETKAKRRVTLSIVGLGILDESEIEDMQASEAHAAVAPVVEMPAAKSAPPQPGPETITSPSQEGRAAGVAADAVPEPAAPQAEVKVGSETVAPNPTVPLSGTPAASAEPGHPASPTPTASTAGANSSTAAASDGQRLSANRIRMFKAKLDTAKITDADFSKQFGKPLAEMFQSQSGEIQAFIDSRSK